MIVRLAVLAVALSSLTGCAAFVSGEKRVAPLGQNAQAAFEGQRIWGRPIETGIELGEELKGTSESFSFLWGLIASGPENTDGGGPLAIFASVLGPINGVVEADPLVISAVGDATQGKADGIYVTHQNIESLNVLGIFKSRKATIAGKAIKLKVLGQVSEERFDRDRSLRAIGNGTVVLPASVIPAVGALSASGSSGSGTTVAMPPPPPTMPH